MDNSLENGVCTMLEKLAADDASLGVRIKQEYERIQGTLERMKLINQEAEIAEQDANKFEQLSLQHERAITNIENSMASSKAMQEDCVKSIDNLSVQMKKLKIENEERKKARINVLLKYSQIMEQQKELNKLNPKIRIREEVKSELFKAKVNLEIVKKRLSDVNEGKRRYRNIQKMRMNNAIIEFADVMLKRDQVRNKKSELMNVLIEKKSKLNRLKEEYERMEKDNSVEINCRSESFSFLRDIYCSPYTNYLQMKENPQPNAPLKSSVPEVLAFSDMLKNIQKIHSSTSLKSTHPMELQLPSVLMRNDFSFLSSKDVLLDVSDNLGSLDEMTRRTENEIKRKMKEAELFSEKHNVTTPVEIGETGNSYNGKKSCSEKAVVECEIRRRTKDLPAVNFSPARHIESLKHDDGAANVEPKNANKQMSSVEREIESRNKNNEDGRSKNVEEETLSMSQLNKAMEHEFGIQGKLTSEFNVRKTAELMRMMDQSKKNAATPIVVVDISDDDDGRLMSKNQNIGVIRAAAAEKNMTVGGGASMYNNQNKTTAAAVVEEDAPLKRKLCQDNGTGKNHGSKVPKVKVHNKTSKKRKGKRSDGEIRHNLNANEENQTAKINEENWNANGNLGDKNMFVANNDNLIETGKDNHNTKSGQSDVNSVEPEDDIDIQKKENRRKANVISKEVIPNAIHQSEYFVKTGNKPESKKSTAITVSNVNALHMAQKNSNHINTVSPSVSHDQNSNMRDGFSGSPISSPGSIPSLKSFISIDSSAFGAGNFGGFNLGNQAMSPASSAFGGFGAAPSPVDLGGSQNFSFGQLFGSTEGASKDNNSGFNFGNSTSTEGFNFFF